MFCHCDTTELGCVTRVASVITVGLTEPGFRHQCIVFCICQHCVTEQGSSPLLSSMPEPGFVTIPG